MVDVDGSQLGIVPIRDAQRIALEKNLDLVEVAPTAKPPVCRIMDYGKFRYEESKREREARKKQKVISIKELKMRPNIEDHDFDVRVKQAEKFLADGDKIKCTIMFRGREIVHAENGRKVLEQLLQRIEDQVIVERPPKVEGRNMIMILSPRTDTAVPVKPPALG